MTGVPSASWFAQMRVLDAANATLSAQNAAYEAGERWKLTIAPEKRGDRIVYVSSCICGWTSQWAGVTEQAGFDAIDHIHQAHRGLG